MSVYWLNSASDALGRAMHGATMLDAEAPGRVRRGFDGTLAEVFPGQVVVVREQLSGYRPFAGLGVLLVEVQPERGSGGNENGAAGAFPSPGVYIVKVATEERRADLKAEIEAWDRARPGHLRQDNIFVSLDPFPPRGRGEPRALVYGDAGTVLGARDVSSLEEAIFRACRHGAPTPASVARLLRLLYQRLGDVLFSRSAVVPPAAYLGTEPLRPRLTDALLPWREPLGAGTDDPLAGAPPVGPPRGKADQRLVRRETAALLARRHDSYADPVDVLSAFWKFRDAPGLLPDVRRGFAHGDLHARNIEVAVVDDRAEYCALFDYEKMRPNNFVAWDFVKMEVECSVRVLKDYAETSWPDFLRLCLTFWRYVAAAADEGERPHGVAGAVRSSFATVHPLPADPKLEKAAAQLPAPVRRLANLVVSLRRLAREALGSGFGWSHEYDFLHAWYATRAGLYENYEAEHAAAALVGAGVSARRLLDRVPAEEAEFLDEATHRPCHEQAFALIGEDDPARVRDGVERLERLRRRFPHVLEILENLALGHIRLGELDAAEALLRGIPGRYRHTTAEFPSRMGSLWKRRATASNPVSRPALLRSLDWYLRGEASTGDYFPAVNVASLMFLLGDRKAAQERAVRVLELLKAVDEIDDPMWPHATRGEALVLIGEDLGGAVAAYRAASGHALCTPRDRRSMRQQLECLRPHLPPAAQARFDDPSLDDLFPGTQETRP